MEMRDTSRGERLKKKCGSHRGKNSSSPSDLVSLRSNWRRGEKNFVKEKREEKRGKG
jgi:hypothetical protein